MNTVAIGFVGNLTRDPELRYTPDGVPVVRLVVAHNQRRYDKTTQEWKDGDASFYECTGWRYLAENAAESLHKGDRVVVVGTLHQRQWRTKDTDEPRSSWGIQLLGIGPELTYATAKVVKAARSGAREPVAPDDPWATGSTEPPAGTYDDEPPF